MVVGQVKPGAGERNACWLALALDSLAEFYVYAGGFAKAEALVEEVDSIRRSPPRPHPESPS
jgi:hypothetical protein